MVALNCMQKALAALLCNIIIFTPLFFSRSTSLFSFEWLEDGQAAIKANNGRYLNAKLNGSLQATSDTIDDKSRFTITVINRPILVLRCDYGFMGAKTAGSNRIECNKSSYDVFSVEHCEDGSPHYYIKGTYNISIYLIYI